MLLYTQIGDSIDSKGNLVAGINGSQFANELLYLQSVCDRINVRINSVGGSVFDGYSIVSAILSSKVPVYTYVDGLAASIAGVIAMAGKKCYIMDYGMIMLHNPSGGNDKEVLDLVKKTLVTIFTNRTSKTAEEIDAMMNKETWLNATEALSHGIVDEIVNSNKKIKVPKSDIYNVALVYNKLINQEKNMIQITNKLGLTEGASEDSIVKAIENKDTQIAQLQAKLDDIKKESEKKETEDKAKALTALTDEATEFVNKAEADGKIKKEEVAQTIADYIANPTLVKNYLEKITGVKTASKIFDPKNVANGEDRGKWTYDEWCKNDKEGLLKLQNEAPELFKAIIAKLPSQLSPNYNPVTDLNY